MKRAAKYKTLLSEARQEIKELKRQLKTERKEHGADMAEFRREKNLEIREAGRQHDAEIKKLENRVKAKIETLNEKIETYETANQTLQSLINQAQLSQTRIEERVHELLREYQRSTPGELEKTLIPLQKSVDASRKKWATKDSH